MSNQQSHRFCAAMVLLALTAGILLFSSNGLAVKAVKPKYPITWAPRKIIETMSLGEIKTVSLTLTSSTKLNHAHLWIVPELQPFVKSITPASFKNIQANTPLPVTIDLFCPHDISPGLYDGTIHLRVEKKTSPPPLKIQLMIEDSENIPPVADAGPDQTVYVGDTVTLNGSGSTDVDGELLTYSWKLISTPDGSTTAISDPSAVNPNFLIDKPGSYVAQLIVNDGTVNSAPDSVTITTANSKPIADAGPDHKVYAGDTVALDGGGSIDVDGNALGYRWSLITKPEGSTADIYDADVQNAIFVPDIAGIYVVQLIVNDGTVDSEPDTATVLAEMHPQVIVPDIVGLAQSTAESTITGEGLSVGPITQEPSSTIPPGNVISQNPVGGTTAPRGSLVSLAVSSGPETVAVPDVIGVPQGEAQSAITAAQLTVGLITQAPSETIPAGNVISQSPAAGMTLPLGSSVNLIVSSGPSAVPPDPATVAPPVDPTIATTIYNATEFLYSGDHPIQTGVAPGTIEVKRAAVVRGKVLDSDNKPLPAVTVTVLNHPEFGQTLSRADGMFDLAVNGGGYLTLNYERPGFLPAQRQVNVPWQDYVKTDDVALLQVDSNSTAIDLSSTVPVQVVRGSRVIDGDGERQATILIPQGTEASVYNPDGSTRSVSTLTVSATEYTVGEHGPARMPAPLPPATAYTYAVELAAAEAGIKIDGKDVLFNKPVYFYLENFLKIPVGTAVPSGYLDRDRAAWLPSDDGQVIKIVSVSEGLALLDTDGDSVVDNGTDLGISDAERKSLADIYAPETTLWRIPLQHLSTYDFNFGWFPGADTPACGEDCKVIDRPLLDCATNQPGNSTIECENQLLLEDIGISGTPFSLTYASDRVPGRVDLNSIRIAVSGANPPPGLTNIQIEVSVAGRTFYEVLPAAANLRYTFNWDGKDAYGRKLQGTQAARVRVGYDYGYKLAYSMVSGGSQRSFGAYAGTLLVGTRGRIRYIAWSPPFIVPIGNWTAQEKGLGGWNISPHHAYDPVGKVLYRGDGTRLSADTLPDTFQRIAGQWRMPGYSPDGEAASDALLIAPRLLTAGPDGSIYFLDSARIRRIDPRGIITTAAGNGSWGSPIPGVPALSSPFFEGNEIRAAMAPDGTLYVNMSSGSGIFAVDPDGIIRYADSNRDIVDLRSSGLDIAVAADGAIYRSGGSNETAIWRQDITGEASIVAPTAYYMRDLTVAGDGSVYFKAGGASYQNYWIQRADITGAVETIAGIGSPWCSGSSGDGGLAAESCIQDPSDITLGPSGDLYFVDQNASYHPLVRKISYGVLETVAGCGGGPGCLDYNTPKDGLTARSVTLAGPSIVWGGDGLYYADLSNSIIYKIAKPLPGVGIDEFAIGDEGGSKAHVFDRFGRHLRTLNAMTGATLYRFSYDADGRLIRILDGDGNTTVIERNGTGIPTAIVAPFGQRTELTVNAEGYLETVTDPEERTHTMTYHAGGLLDSLTNPRNQKTLFAYDELGRLTRDQNAEGGAKSLTEEVLNEGDLRILGFEDALGITTYYKTEYLTNGDQKRTTIWPDGTQAVTRYNTNGTAEWTQPDGMVGAITTGPDPRFGMQTPLLTSMTTKTPAGLTLSLSASRNLTLANPKDITSVVSQTDTINVNGRTSTYTYDGATSTATVTTPLGRKSQRTMDVLGRVTSSQTPGIEAVNYSYTPSGLLESITQGNDTEQRVTTLQYNVQGFLVNITDVLGRMTQFEHDNAGQVTKQIFPDGREVRFTYDANGNILSITPPGRPPHNFDYTPLDLQQSYTPPAVASAGAVATSYVYNLEKQLIRITRPDGLTVDLAYDEAGRLSTQNTPTGTTTYAYAPTTGDLTGISAPGGVELSYTYDGVLPLTETWTGPVAGTVSRSYDNDFKPTVIDLNSDEVHLGYDNDNLLIQAGDLTISRDADNGMIRTTALGSVTTSQDYNNFGEVNTIRAGYSDSELYSVAFTRDKLGRIAQKVETINGAASTYEYTYDIAGRLTDVLRDSTSIENYVYDANGNRLQANGKIAAYDDQDRLITYDGATFGYTSNGELKSMTQGAQTTLYDYDVLGNLRAVTLPSGTAITYVIDGRNRRIGKKIDGSLVQGFLYQDQLKPIAELDGAGNAVARFVYGTRPNVPEYMIKGGVTYRFILDHLGSPRLVVNAATGAIAQRMDYDTWGNVTNDTNPGFQPFGFAGGLYDRDTGLVRFGARDYDAKVGRWTAKDPRQFNHGELNFYEYSLSDPVNQHDHTGLSAYTVEKSTDTINIYDNPLKDVLPDGLCIIKKGFKHRFSRRV